MVDSIKITALQDIGANIAYTTLVPLVNMAGTPTTQKANLQNLGNLILNGAGGSYFARAAQANLALSVANAAQPNITSVGTLTSLVVTGNITTGNINGGNIVVANFYYGDGRFLTNVVANSSYSNSNVANYLPTFTGNVGAGNVNVTGGVYTFNLSSTGLASLTTLTVSATSNLGGVGNVIITGGSAGQKLTTNGNGVLSWTNDANSSYGDSNVVSLLSAFGSNTITTTGNVTVGNIIGNGQALTNIAGANVSGTVGNANLSQFLDVSDVNNNFSYHVVLSAGSGDKSLHIDADDNLQYNPADGTLTATRVDATYVLADLQFSNGYPAANVTGLGNIATINLTGSNANVLYGNGVFAAVPAPTVAQDITSNGAMSIMLFDGNIKYNNYATVEPSSGNIAGGNISANGNISGGNISATGNITANNLGNISSINIDGSNTNVLYGNGVFAAVAGGNANTGNVTFDDNIVIGTGDEFGGAGLFLAPGNGSIANSAVQYLRVRGGDFPTHIHLDTGNNEYYDQYFGADSRYVKLEANGNVVINADDYAANSGTWTFTSGGNLILADGNSVIQSIANSSLDPTLPNVSTMTLTPDQNYNSQALVLDPTAPGHIHLRAYAFSNIDDPAANIFLGGEDTAFEVTSGANNQAVIHSNGKAWTFGNDGNISSDTLTFTTTFANVKTVEYQTAGVWDLYVEDGITGSNTAISRLNVSFKDNLIDKPQVYIENTKESDGIALRWTFDENGNLNFPRDVAGNSDPYLNIFGGSTPTIQSTDVSLAGPANLAIQSDYLNLSGSTGNKIILQADAGAIATDAAMVLSTNLADPGNIVSWTLDTTGNLTLPDTTSVIANVSITLEANDSGNITGLSVIGDANANLYAHGNVTIVSDSSNTTATWAFGADGNLIIPGTSGGFIKTISNASIGIAAMDNGTNNPAQLLSINAGSGAATSIVSAYATNATIQTNASGAINTWAFDNAGNLTLPANTFAINYANGTQVSLGGGNVTWAQLEDKDGNSGPTLIALGQNAGFDGQGNAAIAIGKNAGQGGQGESAITIGEDAGGNTTQGANAVAIGRSAGFDAQGEYSVAIGQSAGSNIQGLQSVAVGLNAGSNTQGNLAVGIGVSAGFTNQGDAAVAIGPSAGYSTQRNEAVAIGAFAGETTQGTSAVAIGSGAGRTSQGNNSIILNATGANLNQTTANTFTVSPVRNDTSNIAQVMFYNTTSKEVTYGNTISVAGNISGGNISATGNVSGTYLISTHASANEGGEISLAQPPNGNLSGGITIDAYQNTLRMFEQGGTARGLSVDIANSPAGGGTAIGYRDIPQVAAGNVTLGATDAGKHYYSTTAGNLTLTIPLNSSVPFTTGTAISIVVQAAGNVLVNAASGVTLYMAGNSTAANRVVGGYGMATLMKVATDTWFINGTGVA